MKKCALLLIVLPIAFLVSCASPQKNCAIGDISGAKTDQEVKLLEAFGEGWMRNALVCQIGEFEIAIPGDQEGNNANIIFVFKKGKPVFYRHDGFTSVYSPKLKDAAFDKSLVHIEHGGDNDNVKRLGYNTVGKDPKVTIDDIKFGGQPDIKTTWNNSEIIEMCIWKKDKWQCKKGKK